MKLTDVDAQFVDTKTAPGGGHLPVPGLPIDQALGLYFRCPATSSSLAGDDHYHFVPFTGRAPDVITWDMSGTGLHDLTLNPSILFYPNAICAGWHGYITSGEVRTC